VLQQLLSTFSRLENATSKLIKTLTFMHLLFQFEKSHNSENDAMDANVNAGADAITTVITCVLETMSAGPPMLTLAPDDPLRLFVGECVPSIPLHAYICRMHRYMFASER